MALGIFLIPASHLPNSAPPAVMRKESFTSQGLLHDNLRDNRREAREREASVKSASWRYLDLQKRCLTMSVSLTTEQELLGLFELDAAGKVLYYRKDLAGEPGGTSLDIVGHNFYNDVAHFENVEEFRLCVTEFIRSATAADSFDFECRYGNFAHRVKVLLARISESVNRENTKSVLVYLKRSNTH
jgi:hypothetical protein